MIRCVSTERGTRDPSHSASSWTCYPDELLGQRDDLSLLEAIELDVAGRISRHRAYAIARRTCVLRRVNDRLHPSRNRAGGYPELASSSARRVSTRARCLR